METTCRELGVRIVAFSPIGQGILTDGMNSEKWDSNKPAKMLRLKPNDIDALRLVVKEMAQKYEKTMAQVALNWCIQHNVIPLVGCRKPSQARDSIGCLGWSLSKDDVERLDQVALDKSTLESKCRSISFTHIRRCRTYSQANSFFTSFHAQLQVHLGGDLCLCPCLHWSWSFVVRLIT